MQSLHTPSPFEQKRNRTVDEDKQKERLPRKGKDPNLQRERDSRSGSPHLLFTGLLHNLRPGSMVQEPHLVLGATMAPANLVTRCCCSPVRFSSYFYVQRLNLHYRREPGQTMTPVRVQRRLLARGLSLVHQATTSQWKGRTQGHRRQSRPLCTRGDGGRSRTRLLVEERYVLGTCIRFEPSSGAALPPHPRPDPCNGAGSRSGLWTWIWEESPPVMIPVL